MRFKIRQKVRVRNDLKIYKLYGKMNVLEGMTKFRGKVGVIESVSSNNYVIFGQPFWTDEMLEGEYQTTIE